MNKFEYTLDNKHYHTYNYYLKTKYNAKVAKVILDAGFTCPNRDGFKGYGGCIYCSNKGSGDSNNAIGQNLLKQYYKNKEIMDKKWQNRYYIPYFQAFTNTYGSLYKIKMMLEPFLTMDDVVEIAIATRADCLSDEILNYLNEVNKLKTITLELGLQSSDDKTAIWINRCHSYQEFLDTIKRISKTDLKICVHILNGLPIETKEMMLKTIKDISSLPIHAIKIHMLHIIKGTKLAELHAKFNYNLLSKEEYIDLVIEQLRLLPKHIVIERLTGDPIKNDLIAPNWLLNKTSILNEIDKKMAKYNYYQGDLYEY